MQFEARSDCLKLRRWLVAARQDIIYHRLYSNGLLCNSPVSDVINNYPLPRTYVYRYRLYRPMGGSLGNGRSRRILARMLECRGPRSRAHLSKNSLVTNCGTGTLCHVISVTFIAHIHSSVQDNLTDVGLIQRCIYSAYSNDEL